MTELHLEYPAILKNFQARIDRGQAASRAFLAWFLEHYYRLEETSAEDSVCDGHDDKGIDGIYVNHDLERIDIFQAKLYQNFAKTLGDVALKSFAGSLDQMKSSAGVEAIISTTRNAELQGILEAEDVPALVDQGYEVRGIFVTNVRTDPAATDFLAHRSDIQIFDGNDLQSSWLPAGESDTVEGRVVFSLDGHGHIQYSTSDAEVIVSSLLASELVGLSGIESQELFDWNVRQTLGKTKVNKAIAKSVSDGSEHKNFLFYHNGLTILAREVTVDVEDDSLIIDGYTVVNGCQSLSTLYDNRSKITDDLRLLARVIRLAPDSELARRITHHSNNQNSINARDLQSNSTVQRRLQGEFQRVFSDALAYEIKRGESTHGHRVIPNDYAGKLLLAFDLEQPWSCHQSYRLFDDLHSAIFGRPQANAHRIAVLDIFGQVVKDRLASLSDQLVATYSLTPYWLLSLLKDVMHADLEGQKLIDDPTNFVDLYGLDAIREMVDPIVQDLIIDVDAEIQERQDGEGFDYKRELKSPAAVRKLKSGILTSYKKSVKRGRVTTFSDELEKVVGATD